MTIMNDTTKSKNLLMRGLSPEVNEALEWGKEHFQVGTNTAAAEKMLSTYKDVWTVLNDTIAERDYYEESMERLIEMLSAKFEADQALEELLAQRKELKG